MANNENYALECEFYSNGACGWKIRGRDFESLGEDGKVMTPSKCLYDSTGIYAGKHPASCTLRDLALSRKNKSTLQQIQ